MRTFKQNIIELEPGESITVRCGTAEIEVNASRDENYDSTLEVKMPPFSHMANLGDIPSGTEWFFAEDGAQELVGPLSFITFQGYQPTDPEFSSLTHPNNA